MRRVETPKPTYLIPIAIGLVNWVIEQWASVQPWYPKVPFDMIGWLSIGFLVGLVVQDLINPKSWLRRNYQNFCCGFMMGEWTFHGHATGGHSITLKLVATREMGNAEIDVRFMAKTRGQPFRTLTKNHIKWGHVSRDENITIPICSVTDWEEGRGPRQQIYWGEAGEMQWGQGPRDSRYVPNSFTKIEISCRSRWVRQTEKLFAFCLEPDNPIPAYW